MSSYDHDLGESTLIYVKFLNSPPNLYTRVRSAFLNNNKKIKTLLEARDVPLTGKQSFHR